MNLNFTVITLLLIKSNDTHKGNKCKSKIMGGLSPIQFKNYEGDSQIFENNSSFIFFYDDVKLRNCS